MMAIRRGCTGLFRPVDLASLAVFRVLFGLLMSLSMVRFLAKGWVQTLYLEPTFFFTYPGFAWVQPWPGWGMYAHVVILAVVALMVACGWYYRISAALFFCGFTYLELLDQTNYLNHYYLISLLSFLMVLCPLHRAWSIDTWRRPALAHAAAPAAVLWLLRTQIAMVYIFAGIAKINPDWLGHAQPLNIWLTAHTDLPLLGPLLAQVWLHYAMSWGSVIFELSIVGLLLWRRTRAGAYLGLVVFHLMTLLLFYIGMFPWIMIASATLFFSPGWPRRWGRRLALASQPPGPQPASPLSHRQRIGLALGVAYLLLQGIVPLRHVLYPGLVLWAEDGMSFSWRVMLVEKTGHVDFQVHDPVTNRTWWISPTDYLTPRQGKMMATRPDLIRQFARHLGQDFARKGSAPVNVYAEAYVSLNGRPSQPFIDPAVDLNNIPGGLASASWVRPFRNTPPAHLRLSPSNAPVR